MSFNKTIFLTGSTGFVGTNLKGKFINKYTIVDYERNTQPVINTNAVIHLAGKAHDLKNVLKPDDYYEVNYELTKKMFDNFLISESKVFIFLSSIKAVVDDLNSELTEEQIPTPRTHYGKSKLLAEKYILSKKIPKSKRVYILRPSMIHGPGNKGNLNLLYNILKKGFFWPLGSFKNKRSYCSIDNLLFIIDEIIENENIESGIYNIADDESISTNEIVKLASFTLNKRIFILNLPKSLVKIIAFIGDYLMLPINTERLSKLTNSCVVSNAKVKNAIKKSLPLSVSAGLIKTFNSFVF